MLLKNRLTFSTICIITLFNVNCLKSSEQWTPEQTILYQKFERTYNTACQQLHEAHKTPEMLKFKQMQRSITLKELSSQEFKQAFEQSLSTKEYKEFSRLAGEVTTLQEQLVDHKISTCILYPNLYWNNK